MEAQNCCGYFSIAWRLAHPLQMEKSLIYPKFDLPPTPTMDTQMHKIPFSAYKSLSWVSLTFD